MNTILIILGKVIILLSKVFNLGNGSTWPGHVVLNVNKNFIKNAIGKNSDLKIILIAGTNGKTTTGKLILTILEANGMRVFQNESGANLLNGITSTLMLYSSLAGRLNYDYAIFEVDEGNLPMILDEVTPDYIVLLNLFRDQLDRYGEVNTIASRWKKTLSRISSKTTLILNADDPQIAFLGDNIRSKTLYFGLEPTNAKTNLEHASDSTYCPRCGHKLTYKNVYFSHLGIWACDKCANKRPSPVLSKYPNYPLLGVYNKYNTLAAVLTAKALGINQEIISKALKSFTPAFGRQESIYFNGKKMQIFLSKNPASLNQSLQTIKEIKGKNILLVLNDRIPDGLDVSWIWDVDFEKFVSNFKNVFISGDRAYDMGLRMKYANFNFQVEPDLKKAITEAFKKTSEAEILYALPTYSAMLDIRKILTGKKIL
ncbi:Mur ligase family protein [Patescibacteria group bacterium]|nr:Mur ligase family protein [Patescibacteria group bacterium]